MIIFENKLKQRVPRKIKTRKRIEINKLCFRGLEE